jgi:hypothetical protein
MSTRPYTAPEVTTITYALGFELHDIVELLRIKFNTFIRFLFNIKLPANNSKYNVFPYSKEI